MSRKVSVYIFRYPEDANRTMSLRRFMQLSEELLFHDVFFSSAVLQNLLSVYKQKVADYAALIGETYVYRIIVRDSDSRLVDSCRI